MASVVKIGSPDHAQQIRQVQVFTIVWMLVEVVVSLVSAWRAHSPALFAFGGDSVAFDNLIWPRLETHIWPHPY
jgi:hypothetical protein